MIIGVDNFAPSFMGVSAGRVALTLLNDKGEKYQINGVGAGGGLGLNIPLGKWSKTFGIDLTRGTKTIVHEMAHFCGNERAKWRIEDFSAYGEPETPKVSKLTLAQRVRHADTFARFAKACGS